MGRNFEANRRKFYNQLLRWAHQKGSLLLTGKLLQNRFDEGLVFDAATSYKLLKSIVANPSLLKLYQAVRPSYFKNAADFINNEIKEKAIPFNAVELLQSLMADAQSLNIPLNSGEILINYARYASISRKSETPMSIVQTLVQKATRNDLNSINQEIDRVIKKIRESENEKEITLFEKQFEMLKKYEQLIIENLKII